MNMQSSGTSSTLGGDCVGSFGSAGSIGSVGGTAGSFATAGTYGCAGAQALCESTPMTQASIKPTVASIRQCELTQASIRQCDFTVASIKPCNFTTATQLTQSCLSTPVPTLATQVTTGSMLTNPGPISSTRLSGGDYNGADVRRLLGISRQLWQRRHLRRLRRLGRHSRHLRKRGI